MSLAQDLLIPKEYGYVLLTSAGIFLLGIWHGARVNSYRKKSGIKYPKHYADSGDMDAAKTEEKKDAIYLFNCAQRAHGNYQENQPTVSIALLVAGIKYPSTAALLGAGWILGRIVFAVGYTNAKKANGSGRLIGSFFWLFQLGLIGLTAWSGIKMLM